ncbi:MAG: hypothetical protein ACRDQ4_19205 [Pseudonocardiaceae bacterium]
MRPGGNPQTQATLTGRHADTARRRQRVITALDGALAECSLQADLLAANERTARLHTRVQHLEKRLSEALGEHAWRES